MKKYIYLLISCSIFYTSCEDVIDVDLNESEPRLVIEASIDWYKNTAGNEQSIKLSLTAPFFDDATPPANGAIVQITDTNSNTFNFIEDTNSGNYINDNFIPVLNQEYTLTIIYNGDIYTAKEILTPVVPIDFIEQDNEGGFLGDEIEIKAYFTDPANIDNYYFFEYYIDQDDVTLDVAEDKFIDGNQIFGFYSGDELEAGNELTIRHYGISRQYYEFMFILLQQGSEEGGGPFETQPATVRGNCINTTNEDNYPFGYFRLSEVEEQLYTIE